MMWFEHFAVPSFGVGGHGAVADTRSVASTQYYNCTHDNTK